jgi:hypothetical protein
VAAIVGEKARAGAQQRHARRGAVDADADLLEDRERGRVDRLPVLLGEER